MTAARPPTGSDRSFGLVFAAFFAIVFGWKLWHGDANFWWLGLSQGFLVVALALPRLLHPLNVIWARFGLLLHAITSPIILGVIFFVVLLPFGLIMRMAGKRPLRLQRDPAATTYWVRREPPGPDADSFLNQF